MGHPVYGGFARRRDPREVELVFARGISDKEFEFRVPMETGKIRIARQPGKVVVAVFPGLFQRRQRLLFL